MRSGTALITAILFAVTASGISADVEQAMVKIFATSANPNYYIPWITEAPYENNGSGCIIQGDQILTNAHMVSNLTYLQVRREGDPKRYAARVVAVSHEADLALLTVDDPAFFRGREPLGLGELPETMQQVTVYGYPVGGDALSTTQGVISRIESTNYAHSNLSLLAVQMDAAINPGNSGGPAIVDGRVIGVAMQSRNQSENIGYVVPVPVIEHFFRDMEDGEYDGFPSAGFAYQKISNPAITGMMGLDEEQKGVIIWSTAWNSPASEVFQPGDVLLELDGHDIAGDGTVELRSGIRTALDHLVKRRQIGDSIPLTVIRDGATLNLTLNLNTTYEDLCIVPHRIYDSTPRYFIFGGVVFMPVSLNYLETWGSEWYRDGADYMTLPYRYANWRTEDVQELVAISYVLPDEVNTGYDGIRNELVAAVDQEPVSGFNELVSLIESSTGEYMVIETNLGNRIILDRQAALDANSSIMARYGAVSDRQME